MAQWDVHANPVASAREELPFVVVVQSELLEALPTTLVVPMTRRGAGGPLPARLAPVVDLDGERLVLQPHLAGVLPRRLLRTPIGSLRSQASVVVDAMDAVVTGV